jgi:hypothetical protein
MNNEKLTKFTIHFRILHSSLFTIHLTFRSVATISEWKGEKLDKIIEKYILKQYITVE